MTVHQAPDLLSLRVKALGLSLAYLHRSRRPLRSAVLMSVLLLLLLLLRQRLPLIYPTPPTCQTQ